MKTSSVKEKSFEYSLLFSGVFALLSLTAIAVFLFTEGLPILEKVTLSEFLSGKEWYPADDPALFGIFPMIVASLAVTCVAALIAIPLGIAMAIYLSEIAGARCRNILKPVLELISAVPSVIIGFLGIFVLAPFVRDIIGAPSGLNLLNAAILLGLMGVPIVCTISEDALRQVPVALREGSLALGATKWETLIKITLPAASPGIVAGVMLGMSRIIGETMVVLMVAGGAAIIPESIFDPIRPIPASIAAEMAEAPFRSSHYHALFAAGIVLFVFTFLFNAAAYMFTKKVKLKTE